MNECSEYTRLLAQAYSKLADDYVVMTQRVITSEDRLRASCDDEHKHFVEATEWKLRAEFAEARVKELEADNTRGAAYVQHLTARLRTVAEEGDAMKAEIKCLRRGQIPQSDSVSRWAAARSADLPSFEGECKCSCKERQVCDVCQGSGPDKPANLPSAVTLHVWIPAVEQAVECLSRDDCPAELRGDAAGRLEALKEALQARSADLPPHPDTVKRFADDLRARLKEASKGEPHTFGFVALFMGMIEESERAARAQAGKEGA